MDELVLIEIYKIFHSTDSKCIFLLKHIEPFPKLTTPQDTSQISINKKNSLSLIRPYFQQNLKSTRETTEVTKNLGD